MPGLVGLSPGEPRAWLDRSPYEESSLMVPSIAPLSPHELLAAVTRCLRADDQDEAIDLAARNWAAMSLRPHCPEDAETCRAAMLACATRAEADDYSRAALWRVRGLARGLSVGWTVFVAALMIPEAFRVFDVANDSRARLTPLLQLRDSAEARGIIEELAGFLDHESPSYGFGPDRETLARLYWEKRGFLLCVARDYAGALDSYARAAEFVATDVRGCLKVRGGSALTLYLRGLHDGDERSMERALVDTTELAEEAAASPFRDIARIVPANRDAMAEHDSNRLICYEAL